MFKWLCRKVAATVVLSVFSTVILIIIANAIEPINGWGPLRFGMSVHEAEAVSETTRGSLCSSGTNPEPPFACELLILKRRMAGIEWGVWVNFLPSSGLARITLTAHDAVNPSRTYEDLKHALAMKYGQGKERHFDDQDRKCNRVIQKWRSGGNVRLYELYAHWKGTDFVIDGAGGSVVLRLRESPVCPDVPAEMFSDVPQPSESLTIVLVYTKQEAITPDRF